MKSLYQLLSIMLSKELWCQPLRTNVSASKAHIISFVLKQKPVQKRRLLFQALVLASDQFSILGAARVSFFSQYFQPFKKKSFSWCHCGAASLSVSQFLSLDGLALYNQECKSVKYHFLLFCFFKQVRHYASFILPMFSINMCLHPKHCEDRENFCTFSLPTFQTVHSKKFMNTNPS